jgi:hypothetical protein
MHAGRCSNVGLAWTSCQKFIMALARRELVDQSRTLSPFTSHPWPSTLRQPSCNTAPLHYWRHVLSAVDIVPRCAPYKSSSQSTPLPCNDARPRRPQISPSGSCIYPTLRSLAAVPGDKKLTFASKRTCPTRRVEAVLAQSWFDAQPLRLVDACLSLVMRLTLPDRATIPNESIDWGT